MSLISYWCMLYVSKQNIEIFFSMKSWEATKLIVIPGSSYLHKQKVCVPQTKVPKILSYFSFYRPWEWNRERLSLQIVLDWCDESIWFACLWRNKVFVLVGNVYEPHWIQNIAVHVDIKASAIVNELNSSLLMFQIFLPVDSFSAINH